MAKKPKYSDNPEVEEFLNPTGNYGGTPPPAEKKKPKK
jgi:hypothetical protein